MGRVYEARDRVLGRRVALKFVHGGDNAELMAEARMIARLAHPNIVAVHGVGTFRGMLRASHERPKCD